MSLRLPSYLFCLVSSSSPVICNYTVVQSFAVYTVIQITFIHPFIHLYIHTLILSHINAYTSYTQYQFTHSCISHPKSCLTVCLQFSLYLSLCQTASFYKWTSCIYLLIIKSVIPTVSGPEMSLIISLLDFGNSFYEVEWILANVYQKPSGFSQILSKVEWILANVYQKSSGFSQILSKAEWILANVYQKPSRFSQMFTKPSGFSQILY